MFRSPTLKRTLSAMKASAKYSTETSSKEDALRCVAKESVVADVLTILQDRVDSPIDLRQEGINILIDEFESEYPDFSLDKPSEETRLEKLRNKGHREPGSWKNNFTDGIGPGVFAVMCSGSNRDEIADSIDELFPETSTRILSYNVSLATYSRTRVLLRLDSTCDVSQLPDSLSIEKLSDLR